MYYYQRLCNIREDHDLTQAELSEILGISQKQYGRYERGACKLPTRHFVTLAKYYNISLDYLAGLVDTPRKLY